MKKYLALTMAACMALSLAACGSSASSTTSSSAAASTEATSDSAATAEATGSDNITGIAQCCDVGTLDDESFNQGCWEAVKGYGDENGTIPENVFCVTFKEEEAGYLAGYAAVKDGFTKLGFLGGMAVPAVIRYGYGYVQGADAAAQEMGINVQMNYYYGGQFYGDEKITAKMDGWYDGGTEVVFACGGGIWTSAAEAADKHDGKLIGVDVDQNYLGVEGVESGKYKANPFVTSAMKGLGAAVKNGLDTVNAGDWSTIAGTNGNFGLEEGDYVGLPTDEASWNFSTFTMDEYNTVLEKIRNGEIKVDNTSDDATKPTTSSNITVDYQV